ncbi:recombinase family protein [Tunturibacter empetritectus]|uniref:recombinase family protein n=1 Tax=Tunturiibacter empetritectus TaxID=3069691 RepID=UPI001619D090
MECRTRYCPEGWEAERPWNQTRVRRILRQERHVGTVVWNRMNRVTNPRTGRVKLHANLPADILRVSGRTEPNWKNGRPFFPYCVTHLLHFFAFRVDIRWYGAV